MKNATIIGFLDGDLGSTSSEVKKLITPILNNEADVIIAKFPPATKRWIRICKETSKRICIRNDGVKN